MKVYRIRNDVNHYQYFLTERDADAFKLRMDCVPVADKWDPPPVFIFKPKHKKGDFFQFNSDILITSPRATEVLRTHLEMAGELLPLPYQGQEFTVLNVTECINCLDYQNTEWMYDEQSGVALWPTKYAFLSNRFTESMLFKIPETSRSEILVVEGLHEPNEEFRAVVQQAGLEGLIFEEIWSDDNPIRC
mgnify:CR=1 FL=1